MKNGFTLIELLAVIVIIAIIALIAVPTITGIIEKTKMGASDASALGYIDAIDKQKAVNLMDSDSSNDIDNIIYDVPMTSYNIKVKGQLPTKGWVEETKNGVDRYSMVVGDYVVSFDGVNKTVIKGTEPNPKPSRYVYADDLANTHIGLPIAADIDMNDKYTFHHFCFDYGVFNTQEECEEVRINNQDEIAETSNSCFLKESSTNPISYLNAPQQDWNIYYRIGLSSGNIIDSIDLCFKDNGEKCLTKDYETNKNIILNSNIANMTCHEESANFDGVICIDEEEPSRILAVPASSYYYYLYRYSTITKSGAVLHNDGC